mmetsp:Transcript_23692/g.72890  ORF Transcript_23692/g.72890 Transcript_23692/m.72890 type:complete len:213 (-) Transcript_23692:560-1198(-)
MPGKLGWRSLLRALALMVRIWLGVLWMILAMSVRDLGSPSSRPKRSSRTRHSRGFRAFWSSCLTRCRISALSASWKGFARSSATKSPSVTPSLPRDDAADDDAVVLFATPECLPPDFSAWPLPPCSKLTTGEAVVLRQCRKKVTFGAGKSSLKASSSSLGSRPFSRSKSLEAFSRCASCCRSRGGRRMTRLWFDTAALMACRIHHTAYVEKR